MGAPPPAVVTAVFTRWPEIVGMEIAAHAVPRSLKGGVLLLEADQPAWASQLRYMATEIRDRITAATGNHEVVDVRVRVVGELPEGRRRQAT